ncbi:MAG TPA: porin PorA family protein [Acidimicrobiales bacterium]|nr:porin PorA family protein [Acidimicrobiales bacterium]
MRQSRWLLFVGPILVMAGLLLSVVGSPMLVRFPNDTNQTMHYSGTATVYDSPSTLAPMSTPLTVPLSIARTVKVVKAGFSTSVIDETIHLTFAGQTQVETYQYVMNRRSMQLLDDPDTIAFGRTGSPMSTDGSYRINFPLSTTDKDYPAWAPETNSTITVTPTGPAHRDPTSGYQVITFDTALNHPVAPYYLAHLESEGLPASLPAATLAAELETRGASVSAVLSELSPHVTSAQLATVAALKAPLPITYAYVERGQIAVEPKTGAVLIGGSSLEGVAMTIAVPPALAGILAAHASLPAVHTLESVLAGQHPVLMMTYHEQPASIRSVAATAHRLAEQVSLIEWQLPLGVVVLGVAVALLGLGLGRRRSRATVSPLPAPRPGAPEVPRADVELPKGA